jgi:Mor family transcriptional regulator
MDAMFDRLDLATLSRAQVAPLDALMDAAWPDTWREFATSQFVTLLSAPGAGAVQPVALAQLAVALTLGIAQDMGGSQPYIPVGTTLAASAKFRRVIELLEQGASYKQAADATGLTESRVRQIEAEWRRQQMAARQGQLPLD